MALVVSDSAAARGLGLTTRMLCAQGHLTICSVKDGTVALAAFEVSATKPKPTNLSILQHFGCPDRYL